MGSNGVQLRTKMVVGEQAQWPEPLGGSGGGLVWGVEAVAAGLIPILGSHHLPAPASCTGIQDRGFPPPPRLKAGGTSSWT